MKKKLSVVIGGSKGHGLEIVNELKARGDHIINISRSKNNKANENICIDLASAKLLNSLKNKIKSRKIDSLIFSQKYRGTNFDEEIKVMVKSCKDIVLLFKNNFNVNSSVVFLSTTAIKRIADQDINYYISQVSRNIISKFFAVKFNKNKVRFNTILPSRAIKKENKKYFIKNKKERKN